MARKSTSSGRARNAVGEWGDTMDWRAGKQAKWEVQPQGRAGAQGSDEGGLTGMDKQEQECDKQEQIGDGKRKVRNADGQREERNERVEGPALACLLACNTGQGGLPSRGRDLNLKG
ncbi:hypothetical protein ERJ75_001678200 [Trypanosoma vivax]|nr:hypothetical protein ERJ75_001678200 [Trypanosoma vivax]